MLNKIKVIGKLLPYNLPTASENKEDKKKNLLFFSALVANPSGSITVLRFIAQNELAEKIEAGEFKENDLLEFRGYLRNEEESRQILIIVNEIKKADKEQQAQTSNNHVRLLGKIITDCSSNSEDNDFISFKIVVPREGNSPVFFCRIQGELKKSFQKNVTKGDVIMIEGFLQTKKITSDFEEGKISRISSIICNSFVLIDKDSFLQFLPLELKKFDGEVKKIDFSKPKEE